MKDLKETKSIDNKDVGEEEVSWEPASNLQNILGLDLDNFVYRWVNETDPENFARKKQEGWIVDTQADGSKTEHKRANQLETGAALTPSLKNARGLILMKLPRKLAEARKRYYQKRTDDQIGMLSQKTKNEGGGVIYGEVKVQVN